MGGNGKLFISHAHEDNALCRPLLDALDAWGVDYWFDTRRLDAGDELSDRIQRAITERDVFVRICTISSQRSFWVRKEIGAFLGLQARDHRQGLPGTRRLIPLRLDPDYEFEPFELDTLYVDAVNKPQEAWLAELQQVIMPSAPAIALTPA